MTQPPLIGRLLAATLLVLAAAAAVALAADPQAVVADEAVLRAAGLATDTQALLNVFRRRTATEESQRRVDGVISDLGSVSFVRRQAASRELVRIGPVAMPALRVALRDRDPEVARRAADCLAQLERSADLGVVAAAARLLAARRPAGASGVLLAYLPGADEHAAAEARAALAVLARSNPDDAALRGALGDALGVRRAAAAEALARTGHAAALELARPLLGDTDPAVRLRTALGMAAAGQRDAVPVLIDLLAVLSAGQAWPAEELLQRVAGEDAPAMALGADDAGRARCRDAWRAWWETHAERADLSRLSSEATLGLTLVAQALPNGRGSVVELGPDKQPRRRIDGLMMPIAAEWLPNGRVLVAEYNANRVTERDFAGTVHWEKSVQMPVACHTRPGGRVFVATRSQALEVDRRGATVFSADQVALATAARGRDGSVALITAMLDTRPSQCLTLDAGGRVLRSFDAGRCVTFAGIDLLSGGRVLIPDYGSDRVVEYDAQGKALWQAGIERPISARRLENGNTLVISHKRQLVAELDRSGQTVWEYVPPDGARPWSARRR